MHARSGSLAATALTLIALSLPAAAWAGPGNPGDPCLDVTGPGVDPVSPPTVRYSVFDCSPISEGELQFIVEGILCPPERGGGGLPYCDHDPPI